VDAIRSNFAGARYRNHAFDMILERGIHPVIIREAIHSPDAEIIRMNPGDARGPSCLILGWWDDRRPLHILLGIGYPLWVITVWDPSVDPKNRWESDFKTYRPAGQENTN
jgi:hypothetical protein